MNGYSDDEHDRAAEDLWRDIQAIGEAKTDEEHHERVGRVARRVNQFRVPVVAMLGEDPEPSYLEMDGPIE